MAKVKVEAKPNQKQPAFPKRKRAVLHSHFLFACLGPLVLVTIYFVNFLWTEWSDRALDNHYMFIRDYQAVPTGPRLLQQKAPTGLLQEQTSRRLPPALQAQQECGSDQWSLLIRRFSKPVESGQEPPRCPHPPQTQSFCPNIGRACPLAFCSCPAVCAISDFETECLTSPGQDQDTPLS